MIRKINAVIQKILSVRIIRSCFHSFLRLNYIFWNICGFVSAFYYLFKGSFYREHRAVLSGMYTYYKGIKGYRSPLPFIRRNIHRLEKGLIMRPLKPVFGKAYIVPTLEACKNFFEHYNKDNSISDINTVSWIHSVLTSYFNTVKPDKTVDQAREIFETISFSKQEAAQTPFSRADSLKNKVSYNNLMTLVNQRHSIRWFSNKSIDRDLLDKALEIAKTAPTACNRMPYEYRFYDDPKLVQKIAELPMGSAGFSQNIPVICVLIGRLDYYFSERDRHVPYIDASLSAMQFMLALETLGLGSCVLNWPDFGLLENKMNKTLRLKPYERPILLIAIGHPDKDGSIPLSLKKNTEAIRSWNRV